MLTENQLNSLALKTSIILKLLNNEQLDIEELKNFLELEHTETVFQKLDGLFRLLLTIIKDNNLKEINQDNILNSFTSLCENEEEQKFINFYYEFLNYLINDDKDLDITSRLDSLLQFEEICDQVANESETKQLYLYNILSLALASAPINYDLVDRLNVKLKKTLLKK